MGVKDRCEGGSELPPLTAVLPLVSLPSLAGFPWLSSMTERTLRSFDSDFRDGGCEFLLDELFGGDAGCMGGGETDRGGEVESGDGRSAHAELDSEKYPPAFGIQDVLGGLVATSDGARSGVEELWGLGDEDGVFDMMESGGRIVNIWSSVVGGP